MRWNLFIYIILFHSRGEIRPLTISFCPCCSWRGSRTRDERFLFLSFWVYHNTGCPGRYYNCILPPEITRRAVLFGVKFCLREKPLSSPLPSAGLCADPRSRVGLAFVLSYAVHSIAILRIRGTRAGPTRTRPKGRPGFNSSPCSCPPFGYFS